METQSLSVEDLLAEFKKIPDWDRYPLPDCIYEKFNIKKPKPTLDVQATLIYQTPPHENLNKNGKIELRGPAEGGVREIKEFMELPVQVEVIPDEPIDQNVSEKKLDSLEDSLTLPKEDNNSETQHE